MLDTAVAQFRLAIALLTRQPTRPGISPGKGRGYAPALDLPRDTPLNPSIDLRGVSSGYCQVDLALRWSRDARQALVLLGYHALSHHSHDPCASRPPMAGGM